MKTAKKRVFSVDIIEKIESTNSFIKENCDKLNDGYLLRAIEQTAGRGRYSRRWVSNRGDDLTFSFLLSWDEKFQDRLTALPQIVAVSLWQLLYEKRVVSQIKWPNDILTERGKLAGILVEGVFAHGIQHVIVGIGLNVNGEDYSHVQIPVSSMKLELGKTHSLDEILGQFVDIFSSNLETLENDGISPFIPVLNKTLAYKGEQKMVRLGEREISGIVTGVSESGELLFRTEDGEELSLISGEISFRA